MIRCLVRELPDTTPNERVEKTLRQFGIISSDHEQTEQQSLIQSLFAKRVEVVKGKISIAEFLQVWSLSRENSNATVFVTLILIG